MPKIATDYSTRPVSFYKFVCQNEEITSSYVGHTVDFIKRKAKHKTACNNPNDKYHHHQIYQIIRDNGGWDNWRMIEIESRLVKDKREAERIEQEWIDKLKADMNMIKSFQTNEERLEHMKQYYIENADKVKEQQKQYYIENNDKIKERKKQYYIENADKKKEANKKYRIENADKKKEADKKYRIENADKKKEADKKYRLKKKANALEATS